MLMVMRDEEVDVEKGVRVADDRQPDWRRTKHAIRRKGPVAVIHDRNMCGGSILTVV